MLFEQRHICATSSRFTIERDQTQSLYFLNSDLQGAVIDQERKDTEAEIGEAVDFVVHVERQPRRRILREVLAIHGYDPDAKRFLVEPVFEVKHATA